MVTAREAFMWKKLREKYGLVGEVAGRYVAAGYSVCIGVESSGYKIDFIASRSNERLCVKIYTSSSKTSVDDIELFKKTCEKLRAKPVLILYGRKTVLPGDVFEKTRELGVSIKRVKP